MIAFGDGQRINPPSLRATPFCLKGGMERGSPAPRTPEGFQP